MTMKRAEEERARAPLAFVAISVAATSAAVARSLARSLVRSFAGIVMLRRARLWVLFFLTWIIIAAAQLAHRRCCRLALLLLTCGVLADAHKHHYNRAAATDALGNAESGAGRNQTSVQPPQLQPPPSSPPPATATRSTSFTTSNGEHVVSYSEFAAQHFRVQGDESIVAPVMRRLQLTIRPPPRRRRLRQQQKACQWPPRSSRFASCLQASRCRRPPSRCPRGR